LWRRFNGGGDQTPKGGGGEKKKRRNFDTEVRGKPSRKSQTYLLKFGSARKGKKKEVSSPMLRKGKKKGKDLPGGGREAILVISLKAAAKGGKKGNYLW